MKSEKISYKNIILEASFVVLGVLLAFSINNYREDIKAKEHSKIAFKSILDEVENNKKLLDKSLTYNKYLIDTLKTYFGKPNLPRISVFKSGIMSRTILFTNAWDMALSTNSLHQINYKKYLKISELYQKFETYNHVKNRQASFVYEDMYKHGTKKILERYINLYGIIISNMYLEQEIQNELKELESITSQD